jgi:hypothetical protein
MPKIQNWHNLHHEVYQKVPELGQKRNAGLTYSILVAISFKNVSFHRSSHTSKAPWK